MAVFITDLDGTLVGPYNEIKPYTVSVLKKLHEQGHKLYFATGRTYEQVVPLLKKYSLDVDGLILLNGAKILVPNQEFESFSLSNEIIKEIIQLYNKSKAYRVSIFTDHGLYQKATVKGMIKQSVKVIIRYGDYRYRRLTYFYPKTTPTIYKIDIQGQPRNLLKIHKKWQEKYGDQYEFVFGSENNLEITAKQANKKDAILKLIELYDYQPRHIYVFGDSGNDEKMLEYFENSYAPQNALFIAKRAANHICLNNEQEGVAKIIDQVIQKSGGKL